MSVAGRVGIRRKLSGASLMVLASLAMPLVPGAALAQAAEEPAQSESSSLGEVVVTASRIVRDGYEAPTPVSVLGAEQIQATAPSNIADLVNRMPAFAGGSNPRTNQSAISSGNSAINFLSLRGLGPTRTLVLFDGHRIPGSTTAGIVDVNTIPNGLISRVDIVTGGASAAWGSDAVAGVVNFVLDKSYEGIRGDIGAGVTTYGDNATFKSYLSGGKSFADGRGHFLASVDYAYNEGIDGMPRDWYRGAKRMFNPTYTATNGQPNLLVREGVGYSTAAPGAIITSGPLRGIYFGPNGQPAQLNYGSPLRDPFMVGGDWQYTDIAREGDLDAELKRYGAFARASYQLTDNIEVYGQFIFGRAESAQISTPQYNFANITIQRANPFLDSAIVNQMTTLGLNTLTVGSWNGDLGGIALTTTREQFNYQIGATGDFAAFGTEWKWDAYAQTALSLVTPTAKTTITANYNRAIDAVRAPNGAIVCRSTLTDPTNGCVPYNILGTGTVSEAAKAYVLGESWVRHRMTQSVVAANVRGEPLNSWAGPVSVAAGVEYREEAISGENDALSNTNAYWAGNYKTISGSFDVLEGFVETVVPLMRDTTFGNALDFNAAVRVTDYSSSGVVTTWKAGLTYEPTPDIRIRATRSRDIRAANLSELFQAGTTSTNSIADPFRNNASTTFFQITSGRTDLSPEKADTYSFGVILQPRFLPGFSAAIDYFDIKIEDAISTINATTLLNQCYAGNSALCSQIIRDSAGVITQINVQPVNLANDHTQGIDFEFGYRTPLSDALGGGNLSLRALATNYLKGVSSNGINVPDSRLGENAGGLPEWRYTVSASYSNDPLTVTLTGRGLNDGVVNASYIECTTGCPTSTSDNTTIDDNSLPGAIYIDAAASYKLGNGVEIYGVVDNLLDRDPSRAPSTTTVGGPQLGVDGSYYDLLGRTFRAGVRFKF